MEGHFGYQATQQTHQPHVAHGYVVALQHHDAQPPPAPPEVQNKMVAVFMHVAAYQCKHPGPRRHSLVLILMLCCGLFEVLSR